ncbi:MAG: [protein-PII] uridylyltransferase, partial [Myxococcales bacterium]|nr:[protein-PII] uridylyltransferase [Myxococcales bacterium]
MSGPVSIRPPASPSPTFAHELRDAVEQHRSALEARLVAGEDGVSLGRANARFLDECLRTCFGAAARAAGLPERGAAVAAVGSFGRGAVALRSDADIVLVVEPTLVGAREATAFAEALLYPLWDATLAVGHQVISAADAVELGAEDLATATELLDLRVLAGDEALVKELVARANEGLFNQDELGKFIERLEAEAEARHERFGGSVYLLEPDVKSGAGGLRDIDGVGWAARARYRVGVGDPRERLGTWGELLRCGALAPREATDIAAAQEFLWRLRNRLHARDRRKADRLGFEEQEALAVAMGYGDDRARAAERLMQDYYRHARAATRTRASVFLRLKPSRRRTKAPTVDLGGNVHLFDGHVTIAGTAELQADPALALRAYVACVRQGAPLLSFARDAIARASDDSAWCERLRASAEAGTLFVELVSTIPEARTQRGSVVAELHDVGLLLAMVPEFLPVTGQVHHDVYHVYTVDAHSVAAVDRLRQLARGELAHEYALASRLAAEIARPRQLFLATLLHDVGKGWPDANGSRKGHSKTGADLCGRILPRLGLTPEDVDDAQQLVLQHLLMYHVATRRDLDDAATIEEFCRSVRGREGLRNLYLLTVADLSTTSPTAMTSWKARMLDELYFAAEAHLAGKEPREDAERVARVRDAARRAWSGPREVIEAHLGSMPERYLLANEPEAIVQHSRIVAARDGRPAHVGRVPAAHGVEAAAELCVVADDRPGLLASIAAAITANRLEVLAAQVYSRYRSDAAPRGAGRAGGGAGGSAAALGKGAAAGGVEAVDLFWVRDREGGTEGIDPALPRLARDLEDLCAGRVDPAELLRSRVGGRSPWRERPSPAVTTEVLIDDRASPRHTVVEVFAKDRPGLLYTLARSLHELGLSIALSKINTEGMRVADVFYVSELDGSKLAAGDRYRQVHDA